MGKKAREYKSGDFIFAKVKGYPAWPARVQRLNGKKYFVYFYGTGETANLPSNMIFDYAENKDKFLTKTQKRRDFNDGVKQIEHDFANNVPLEAVIGAPMEVGPEPSADDTANDSANSTMDENADTTAADTADDDTITNTTQNDTVEDSDEINTLVIDEGKGTKKKTKAEVAKTPAKDAPKAKEPKTPRGKAKKDEPKKDEEGDEEKKEEEIVSRSGRKIRPKRFVDEQTEENSTLPSPAAKKRRGASPSVDKNKTETEKDKPESAEKNIKCFNAVTQSELEELKQPFKPEDADKENILIAYLPTGKYVGIKLFQSRPTSFKNESTRLQWDKQAASNAITLRMQLERGQITGLSVQGQLVMDLKLTDEEKATLDKERETEEKKSRVQFLKNEMRLIELDAKIKTCLSLEKADTDLCLKLLDQLVVLDVKPLMLLKHPTCLETVKRMRAYVGNTPSWDLSEKAALLFSKEAHKIRKLADIIYKSMKNLFTTPDGLSFWEFFSERVLQFKKIAAKLSASELLEMVHEPIEMSQPTSHTMKAAIDAANEIAHDDASKKKSTPAKPKKTANNNTTPAAKGKRQSTRKQPEPEAEMDEEQKDAVDNPKEQEIAPAEPTENVEMADTTKETEEQATSDKESVASQDSGKSKDSKKNKNTKEGKKSLRNAGKAAKDTEKTAADTEMKDANNDEKAANEDEREKDVEIAEAEKVDKEAEKDTDAEKEKDAEKGDTAADKDAEKTAEPENTTNDADVIPKVVENAKDDDSKKEPETSSQDENVPKDAKKAKESENKTPKSPKKSNKDRESSPKEDKNTTDSEKNTEASSEAKGTDEPENNMDVVETPQEPKVKDKDEPKEKVSNKKDAKKNGKDDKNKEDVKEKEGEKRKAEEEDKAEKIKEDSAEPRAKRSRETRESKKTEAVPRSPAKRKSKH